MSAVKCFVCAAAATMWAETPTHDVALCDQHYEAMIQSAEKHNPEWDPGVVRSCMERASYPVRGAGDTTGAKE